MTAKSYAKKSNFQTDAFLNDPVNPAALKRISIRSAASILSTEARPIELYIKPDYVQAIKAAKRKNRKENTRRFIMRLVGLVLVLFVVLMAFISCQYTPTPNVYETDGFQSEAYVDNNRPADSVESYNENYETPIVGIFHPHSEDEIEPRGESYNENDDVYELASDTSLSEIKSENSLFVEIDNLIENNELTKARQLISSAILNRGITANHEDELLHKLKNINSQLLTSIDEDGDCKEVTIEKGQTLYAISKANKITVDAIVALNNMDPNKYNAGQKIKVYKNQFHLIVRIEKGFVYLWQNDHIVERYNAKINDISAGIFRLKGKKKGSLGELVYTNNLFIAPESKDLTTTHSIKLSDDDFKIINMLLVTNALLDIK